MRGTDGRPSARLFPGAVVALTLICFLGTAIRAAAATTDVAVPLGTPNSAT